MHYLTYLTYLTSYLLGPYKLCRLWACTCAALVISALCSLLSALCSRLWVAFGHCCRSTAHRTNRSRGSRATCKRVWDLKLCDRRS